MQVTFAGHNPDLIRGVTHCFKCNEGCGLDVAICKLKLPVGAITPVALNLDHYTVHGPHGRDVTCVGTKGGLHHVGPKKLEYEANGAHLYVSNAGGSGMHAGDSVGLGGALQLTACHCVYRNFVFYGVK